MMGIRVIVKDGEPLDMALRRLKKLLERQKHKRPTYFVRKADIRRAKKFHNWWKARRVSEDAKRRA
jgi:ribosomal protein S21